MSPLKMVVIGWIVYLGGQSLLVAVAVWLGISRIEMPYDFGRMVGAAVLVIAAFPIAIGTLRMFHASKRRLPFTLFALILQFGLAYLISSEVVVIVYGFCGSRL